MLRTRILLVLVSLLLAACASEKNPDSAPPAASATPGVVTWAISDACSTCLQTGCATMDAGPGALQTECLADAACAVAFAKFTSCYAKSRLLSPCQAEVDAIKASGEAGRELLQTCLLLACFDGLCEAPPSGQDL
jgi:hypothetical protein